MSQFDSIEENEPRVPALILDTNEAEERAVIEVLRGAMLVQHDRVRAFESLVAELCGRKFGIAVSSGTAALSVALEAFRLKQEDKRRTLRPDETDAPQEILVPALTWPSPAHAAQRAGYRVRFVDVDPDTWNVTPACVEAALTEHVELALVIDQFGNPVDADGFDALMGRSGLSVVEDAACALMSRFSTARPCGALGTMSTISFHPKKVFTTGEGGVVLTDDKKLADVCRALRNHGQHIEAGTRSFVMAAENLRMTELAAAIGLVQLERRDAVIEARRKWAKVIRDELSGVLQFQKVHPGSFSNEQTLGALLPLSGDIADKAQQRDHFVRACNERGVGVGRLSYHVPSLKTIQPVSGQAPTPIAEDIDARGIGLPLYPKLTEAMVTRLIEVIRNTLQGAFPS